jgi:hypothetical protein
LRSLNLTLLFAEAFFFDEAMCLSGCDVIWRKRPLAACIANAESAPQRKAGPFPGGPSAEETFRNGRG